MEVVDNIFLSKIVTAVIILIIAVIVLSLGLFRINTGQGAVVTHIGGTKDATTRVGWHFIIPLLESYKKYPVVNDYVYFPQDTTKDEGGSIEAGVSGAEINAKDDTVVD